MSPFAKHHVVEDGAELVGRTIVRADISTEDGPVLLLDDDSLLLVRVHDDERAQLERVWLQRPPPKPKRKRAKRKGAAP